jgi:hypothetical protein
VVCANLYDLVANLYLFLAPLFASRSACSFPSMFVCALTLDNVVSCVRFFSISTIEVSMDLSAWLLCWVGCFICVLSTYIQLRQSVNMWAGSFIYLVVISLSVLCMTISSALKHVCSPGSLLDICTSVFVGL